MLLHPAIVALNFALLGSTVADTPSRTAERNPVPAAILLADAQFIPVDPARPSAAQIAVLHGDPTVGPADMMIRMARGDGQRHIHSSDYRLVVVRGIMKHWQNADDRASAPEIGPGGYWFQPGGEAHGDDCLSEECLMFVSWSGPRDTVLAK